MAALRARGAGAPDRLQGALLMRLHASLTQDKTAALHARQGWSGWMNHPSPAHTRLLDIGLSYEYIAKQFSFLGHSDPPASSDAPMKIRL